MVHVMYCFLLQILSWLVALLYQVEKIVRNIKHHVVTLAIRPSVQESKIHNVL